MTAQCPCCERENCKVSEQFMQATRTEPMKSLGYMGYCPDCAVGFRIECPQLVLSR
jgi:hypothetical protein